VTRPSAGGQDWFSTRAGRGLPGDGPVGAQNAPLVRAAGLNCPGVADATERPG